MSIDNIVGLFDLGNTLVTMEHKEYVLSTEEGRAIIEDYDAGDSEANDRYEVILEQGLEQGLVRVAALDGVEDKLREMKEAGLKLAVFSTCTANAVRYALEQTRLAEYVDDVYSTFDYNLPVQDKNMKTFMGYCNVSRDLREKGMDVCFFVDDKLSELEEAKGAFWRDVDLYCVTQEGVDDQRIVPIRSIADINPQQYLTE